MSLARMLGVGRITGFDWGKYLRAIASGYVLMGVMTLCQLVLVPFYLEFLGVENFGILTMMLSACNYVAIGVTWLSGGMTRVLSEHFARGDLEGFASGYVLCRFLYVAYSLFVVTVVWMVLVLSSSASELSTDLFHSLILASLYLVVLYAYNAERVALASRHLQWRSNLYEIVGQGGFFLTAYISLVHGFGLVGVMFAQLVGMVLVLVIAVKCPSSNQTTIASQQVSKESLANIWKRVSGSTGFQYVFFGVLILTIQADVLLVGWLSDANVVAKYYLLWRIPEIAILLLSRIPGTLGPFVVAMDAKNNRASLKRIYVLGYIAFFSFAGVGALVYGIYGSNILGLWVGSDKALTDSCAYTLAALAMFCVALTKWPIYFGYSLVLVKPLNGILCVELALKLFLCFIFIDDFRYLTPVVSTLSCFILVLGVLYYLYSRHVFCVISKG